MKRIILAVMLGALSVPPAWVLPDSKPQEPSTKVLQCKYTLDDARNGLSGLVALGFTPKKVSEDGNRVMGFVFYHDPKSSDPESVEAAALVLRDKRAPDKELTLVVSYNQDKQVVTFKREMTDGGKSIGPCFEKEVEAKK